MGNIGVPERITVIPQPVKAPVWTAPVTTPVPVTVPERETVPVGR